MTQQSIDAQLLALIDERLAALEVEADRSTTTIVVGGPSDEQRLQRLRRHQLPGETPEQTVQRLLASAPRTKPPMPPWRPAEAAQHPLAADPNPYGWQPSPPSDFTGEPVP
jgi:hypothetical protein